MSFKKKKALRILGLLTAISVLTATVPMTGFSVTESSLNQQIQKLDDQIKEKEQKLQEIRDQQGETKAYQEVLQGLVNDSMARIDNLAAQMDQQDAEIASLDDKFLRWMLRSRHSAKKSIRMNSVNSSWRMSCFKKRRIISAESATVFWEPAFCAKETRIPDRTIISC